MLAGKRHDIEDIFDRHFEAVYAYIAYRVMPDFETAKDITQEVFLAAIEGLPEFRGDATVLTWLRSIARRKVANHFRALTKRGTQSPLEPRVPGGDPAVTEPQDQVLIVSLTMRELPSNYIELLEEKYLEGLSVKEMAQRRKLSEKAVESALSRARNLFKKTFDILRKRKEREI